MTQLPCLHLCEDATKLNLECECCIERTSLPLPTPTPPQAIWKQVEGSSGAAQQSLSATPERVNPKVARTVLMLRPLSRSLIGSTSLTSLRLFVCDALLAQVIHPQPPSAYNPRDLLASSEIIMHSPGDSDMQRVPTHVFLRELSSQKEKEKTKIQETAITRLLRRSLAERPLIFASAFAKVVGASGDASSADSLVRNSAKLQLNYNQFREGLRSAGMGLGDEDFEMV